MGFDSIWFLVTIMNWIKSAAIIIWIRAHSDFLFRGLISFVIYLISNSIYSKYEAVLLVTNPEKLFIPLYIYTCLLYTSDAADD